MYFEMIKQKDQHKLFEFKYEILSNICDKHPKKRDKYDIESLEFLLKNNKFFKGE